MSEIAQVELLPCPFCGSDDLLISEKPSNDKTVTWFSVHHGPHLHCAVSLMHYDKDILIKEWDSRASISLGAARDILAKSKEKIDGLESTLSLYKQKVRLMQEVIDASQTFIKTESIVDGIALTGKEQALNSFNEQHKEIK